MGELLNRQGAARLRAFTLAEGVMLLVLGGLALIFPVLASVWVTAVVAVAFLVGGIVKDDRRRRKALDDVARAFLNAGVPPRAVMVSPITGEKGNLEYLLYASAQGAPHPTEWDGSIATAVN